MLDATKVKCDIAALRRPAGTTRETLQVCRLCEIRTVRIADPYLLVARTPALECDLTTVWRERRNKVIRFRRRNHDGSLTARATWISEGDPPEVFPLIDILICEFAAGHGNGRIPSAEPGPQ